MSGAGPSVVALAERNLDEVEKVLAESFHRAGLTFCVRRLAAHG